MAHDESAQGITTIRVVVVDDHTMLRTGLARMLEETGEITVVASVGNVAAALEKVEVTRPDVVVLDITLGTDNALDALPEMLRKSKQSRVLVLSMHDEPQTVQDAFAAGAEGYLLKDAAEADLVEAVRTLARGERYVHPTLGARLARAALAGPSDPLTDREREVAKLLALGHTNHEVGAQLYLSVRTVESHRASIMSKLGLHSRADLVQWALDAGLIGSANH